MPQKLRRENPSSRPSSKGSSKVVPKVVPKVVRNEFKTSSKGSSKRFPHELSAGFGFLSKKQFLVAHYFLDSTLLRTPPGTPLGTRVCGK